MLALLALVVCMDVCTCVFMYVFHTHISIHTPCTHACTYTHACTHTQHIHYTRTHTLHTHTHTLSSSLSLFYPRSHSSRYKYYSTSLTIIPASHRMIGPT